MIKEIPFQYDLENLVLELKFQSELFKIVKHYDSLTIAEEAEAVRILLRKTISLMSIIRFPSLMRWPQAVMYHSRSSQLMIFDSCSWYVSRARTISYRSAVIGTSETHHGDIKAVSFKETASTKSGNKTPSVSKAESVLCQFCGKNNHSNADYRTRTSEFTNNQNRPYIGSEAHGRLVKATGIPNFKELKVLMSKAGQSSGPSSSASKTNKPSKDWKSKGAYVSAVLPIKLHIATSPNLLPVVLTFVSQEEAKGSINVDTLLDT